MSLLPGGRRRGAHRPAARGVRRRGRLRVVAPRGGHRMTRLRTCAVRGRGQGRGGGPGARFLEGLRGGSGADAAFLSPNPENRTGGFLMRRFLNAAN